MVRFLVLAAWIGCFGFVVFHLLNPDKAADTGGVALAQLTNFDGTVSTRRSASILWDDSHAGESLRLGDVVSTGPSSHATIDFPDGRRLKLGPDSMIGIEHQSAYGSVTSHIKLRLLKGNVAATIVVKPKPAPKNAAETFDEILRTLGAPALFDASTGMEPMLVDGGNGKSLEIKAQVGKTTTLEKTPGSSEVKQVAVASKPSEATASATSAKPTSLTMNTAPIFELAPVPVAVEKVEPKPKPKLKPIPIPEQLINLALAPPPPEPEPVVEEPPPDPATLPPILKLEQYKILVTGLSLRNRCAGADDLKFPVEARPTLKPDLDWQPLLDLRTPGSEFFRVFGKATRSRQTIRVSMRELCESAAAESTARGIPVEIVPGYVLDGEAKRGPAASRMMLVSLPDLPDGAVTAHFRRLTPTEKPRSTWLGFSSTKDGPFRLRVRSNNVLQRLWRYFAGDGRIAISGQDVAATPGTVQFYDGEGWLGTLAAPALDPRQARQIALELGAKIAFAGPPESYVVLPIAIKARLNLIEDSLRTTGEVYLITRSRSVRVTKKNLDADMRSVAALGQSTTIMLKAGAKPILP